MNHQNGVRWITSDGRQGTYYIYLVGFPHRERSKELHAPSHYIDPADWIGLVPHLAPKASIIDFNLFSEESLAVNSVSLSTDQYPVTGGKRKSPTFDLGCGQGGSDKACHMEIKGKQKSYSWGSLKEWSPYEPRSNEEFSSVHVLEKEARRLLDTAKEQDSSKWKPIIFLAYGLGGLIVKQAIIIANTEPKYSDIALRTHKLVFVATPHIEADLATWEDILVEMIATAGAKIRGRKSCVLSELSVAAKKIWTHFHCALNYRITNLPRRVKWPNKISLLHEELSSLGSVAKNDFPLEFSLPTSSLLTTTEDQTTELDFGVLLYLDTVLPTWDTESSETSSFYSDLLDFLQALSVSHHLFHQSTSFQVLDDDPTFGIHVCHAFDWQQSNRGCIQVIGPLSLGKTMLVKHIVQKVLCYTPNVLFLDMLLETHGIDSLKPGAILQSLIHQIISQRPLLFSQIRPNYRRYRKSYGITRQVVLWNILCILIRGSRGGKIILAVNNIHPWPKGTQGLQTRLEELFQFLNYDYLFVSRNITEIPDLHLASPLVINLELGISNETQLIQTRSKAELFTQPPLPQMAAQERPRDIHMPNMHIACVESYMEILSRGAVLRDSPEADEAMFYHLIKMLTHDQLRWSCSIISWVQKAVRPLRIIELAAAVALGDGSMGFSGFTLQTSLSIEPGILQLLNIILRVESGRAYIFGPDTRELLAKKNLGIPGVQSLPLLTHKKLAELCLHYVYEIVSNISPDIYLAQMTWHRQVQADDEQQGELNFLNYAVKHWHTHYHSYSQLCTSQEIPNREEEVDKPLHNLDIEPDGLDAKIISFLEDDIAMRRWYQLLHIKLFPKEDMVDGVSALEVATELGLDSIVERLLLTKATEGSDIVEYSKSNRSTGAQPLCLEDLLCTAIRHGHSRLVEFFLGKGAERNKAILEAAGLGRVDYLQKLLPEETFKQYPDCLLKSALCKATEAGSLQAVQFFDKVTLHCNWKDDDDRMILHAAATGGEITILQHITQRRQIDLNVMDKDGKPALVVATQLNHTPFVEALCKRGADTTLAINNGKTALHYAIVRDPEIVMLLLQHKASPIEFDGQKQTPLHFACRLGNLGIVIALVKALSDKGSIDIRNDGNETALHIAAACGHLEIVSFLLDHGADALAENSEKQKPIDHAAAAGHSGVLKMLHSHLEANVGSAKMLTFNQMLVIQSVSNRQLLITQFLLKIIKDVNFIIRGYSPLGVAASKGYTDIVRLLLQNNAKLNILDGNGCSPLHGAVSGAHTDIVTLLLDNGANPNLSDAFKQTPLHRAASRGMAQMVGILLNHKHKAYWISNITEALHLSLAYPEIVEMLLQFEPESASPHRGATPLHSAVTSCCIASIQLLVAKDKELIYLPDERQCTPLHRSLTIDRDNTDILCLLLSKCNLNLDGDWYLNNPLIIHALEYGNLNAVRLLLAQYPAMAISKNHRGYTALHTAAENGHAQILEELLSTSEDLSVDIRTEEGKSPLHLAVAVTSIADIDIILELLKLGADINAVDNEGRTALYEATISGNIDMAVCLLRSGANPNLCTNTGSAPLQMAVESAQMLNALLLYGAKVDYADKYCGFTALMQAVYGQNEEAVKILVEYKASVNIANRNGETALHMSMAQRNPQIGNLLLDVSADVTMTDHEGMTPLHLAVLSSKDDEIDLANVHSLLERGAMPNCKDNEGQTPLHYAVTKRSQRVMEKLIEAFRKKGLNIDERNNFQQTPLHLALSLGTYEMSNFLIDVGANVNERDEYGASSLAFAAAGEDSERKIEILFEIENRREDQTPLWDLSDKIAAFMMARTIDLRAAKLLATSNREIFQGQNDTFTILNICVDYGQYDEAIEFLQLGADPFRHEDGQLSAFQNASLAKDPSNSFLKACMKKIDDNTPGLEVQLQILALMIEHGWTNKYPKLQQWKPTLVEQQITDYDGWTINDMLYQGNQERPMSNAAIVPRSQMKFRTPTRLLLPKHWSGGENLENNVSLSTDGKKITSSSGLSTCIGFRADHPFRPRDMKSRGFYYFEVEIVENGASITNLTDIGIGICGEFAKIDGKFLSQPFRTPLMSYYNNGDLYDYLLNSCEPTLEDQGFSKGDIVGCGIDWRNHEVYYTLNGELVDRIDTSVIFRKVYPVIIIGDGPCTVKVNFGKKTDGGRLKFKFPVPR